MNPKTVFVATNGCPENRLDSARAIEMFKNAGFRILDNPRKSDLILFNACGLTSRSEEESIRIIRKLQKIKKSSAQLVAYGCLPKINKDKIRKLYHGPTFGSDEIDQLGAFLGITSQNQDANANYLIDPIYKNKLLTLKPPTISKLFNPVNCKIQLLNKKLSDIGERVNAIIPEAYVIKTSTGCLSQCSYCAVKLSRGTVKSKSIESIEKEFMQGLKEGNTEFAFIGTDLGAYGRDRGTDLANLLEVLIHHDGDYKIRLRNIHPRFLKEMMPKMEVLLSTGKISYLGSAVQSGNNRILSKMNRRYTVEEYKDIIKAIHRSNPATQIRTQIITGFPGESDKEFEDSLHLLDELHFDMIEVYPFSPRENTVAATIPGAISTKIANARRLRMLSKALENIRTQ